MEQKLLTAIMGAVAVYIQQEESSQSASGINAWRLLGQRAQMTARTNARQVTPLPGRGVWRYCGLEKLMTARARRGVREGGG